MAGSKLVTLLSNALIPIFAGLALGYLAGLRKVVDNRDLRSLITFLMSFALPCYLFATIGSRSRTDLSEEGTLASVLAIVYLAAYCLTYISGRLSHQKTTSNSAILALTLAFPNATAVGVPLLQAAYGPKGNVACAVGIAIGAITISPVTLAILEGAGEKRTASFGSNLFPSFWKAIKRPVVWSPVLGIIAVVFGVHLPPYADRTLSVFASATAGSALFITGLVVSALPFHFDLRICLWVLIKNIGQPAICLAVARLFLPVEQVRYAVLICAIPCGFFGLVFGKNFGSTSQDASSTLIASYILSIFTLAGWIVLLNDVPQGFL